MPDESRLVYSSDGEHIVSRDASRRPVGGKPAAKQASRRAKVSVPPAAPADGTVRIHRSTGGRNGKTVTLIVGLPGDDGDLDRVLKVLKQHCGAGGTRNGASLEIQGDHRERVRERLEALGHRVKLAGG